MKKLFTFMCFLVCVAVSAQTLEVSHDEKGNAYLLDESGKTVAGPYASVDFNSKFNVWTVKTSKGKFGMLSASGKEILPAKYSFFGEIADDGTFWVNSGGKDLSTQKSVQKSVTSHMNSFSKNETDPEKLYQERERYEDLFSNGMMDRYGTKVYSGKYGFADCSGKVILDVKYNLVAKKFSNEGLAWYAKGSKYGVVDKNSNVIVAPSYKRVYDFYNSVAIVLSSKNKYGYINTSGKLVTPTIFSAAGNADNVLPWVKGTPSSTPSSCFSPRVIQSSGGIGSGSELKYALVGPDGQLISALKYDFISYVCDGMSVCSYNGGVTYVNADGVEIAPPIFTKAGDFEGGLAVAALPFKTGTGEINASTPKGSINYFGLIDKQGRVVVPFIYSDFKGRSEGTFLFKDASGAVWLDNDGNRLFSDMSFMDAGPFSNSVAPVCYDGKWGYMDRSGNIIVECMFQNEAVTFEDDYAWVMLEGKYGAVDKKGTVVVPILLDTPEDAMELCRTSLKENGGKPLGIRDVEVFGKKRLNQRQRFSITDTIPEDNWDF